MSIRSFAVLAVALASAAALPINDPTVAQAAAAEKKPVTPAHPSHKNLWSKAQAFFQVCMRRTENGRRAQHSKPHHRPPTQKS